MRKRIRKLFFVWDFDKEENWLNEMAAKGLALVSVGWCTYDFEDSLPGEYDICLQYLDRKTSDIEKEKYINFLEETGAEHVGSFHNWIYLRKKSTDGKFELFSDNTSRIKYMKNTMNSLISLSTILTIINLYWGFWNFYFLIAHKSYFNIGGILNFIVAAMLIYGIIKFAKKRNKLKKELNLFE